MLKISDLTLEFQKKVFENTSFSCQVGEVVSIYGESGCGKTTFLKYIMGEVNVQSGRLFYNKKEINDDNRDDFLFNIVSYIDQDGSYFPNMNIKQHFRFYCQLYKLNSYKELMKEYLKIVHLEHINVNKSPIQLSTGERKRFLLAIAFMLKKKIIILDEPTASVDDAYVHELLDIIRDYASKGITFMIATHDQRVLNRSHRTYEIKDCQFHETVKQNTNICLEENVQEYNKPHKIRYFRYKNFKLKILLVFIILIGGICLGYTSRAITRYLTLNSEQSQEEYSNQILFLIKSLDVRYPFDNYMDLLADVWNDSGMVDIISDKELDAIRKIEGVKKVLPTIDIEKYRQAQPITIYQNDHVLKEVSTKASTYNHTAYARDIIVTGYYPDENIMKDGKKADGVYINEILEQILDLSSYEDISISFTSVFQTHFNKSEENEDIPSLFTNFIIKDVNLSIDGVLKLSDYDDGRFSSFGRVYMPVDKINALIEDAISKEDRTQWDIPFQSRQYMIICEEGKDEDVKLAIEESNDLYYAESKELTKKEVINYLSEENRSTLIMTVLSSFVLISGLILCLGYYSYQRKKEAHLLSQNGLSQYIKKYLSHDDLWLLLGWQVISSVVLCFVLYVIEVNRNAFSVSLYICYWESLTFMIALFILLLKRIFLKRLIKGVVKND